MIQKKVKQFFETHPTATEVHVALGVLFVEPEKANKYLAGTQNQKVQTITKEDAAAWEETKADNLVKGNPSDQGKVPADNLDTNSNAREETKADNFVKENSDDQGKVPADDSDTNSNVFNHEVTKEDMVNNPELKDQGVSVGDVVQVPFTEEIEGDKIKQLVDKEEMSEKATTDKEPANKNAVNVNVKSSRK